MLALVLNCQGKCGSELGIQAMLGIPYGMHVGKQPWYTKRYTMCGAMVGLRLDHKGSCADHVWTIFGPCLDHVGTMLGVCMGHVCPRLECALGMFRACCLVLVRGTSEIRKTSKSTHTRTDAIAWGSWGAAPPDAAGLGAQPPG